MHERTGEDVARFEVLNALGEGGAGVVVRARDRVTGEIVAVKTVRSPEALAILKNEFRVVQGIHHPNLVQIRDLVLERGEWRLSMEYVDGVDLLQHVEGAARRGPEERERCLRSVIGQLVAGLAALHAAGRIHRDVKPSNVLVTDTGRVVILDFGITVDATGLARRSDESIHGTALYMAPEQVTLEPLSPAADAYAVGVILYRALTGCFPFDGPAVRVMESKVSASPPDVRSRGVPVPEDLAALCMRLLAIDAAARPDDQELLARLGGSADGVASPTATPVLSGRGRELEVLRQAYADARAGSLVVVLVEGESGVGKSVFARAFAEELRASETAPLVFFGRCYEREAAPFKAFGAIVAEIGALLEEQPPDALGRWLTDGAGLLLTLFPELARVTAIASREDAAAKDPIETRRRAFTAMRALLARIREEHPILLVLDDLQWIDADSVELLAELTRAPAPPLLIVGTTRLATEDGGRAPAVSSAWARDARTVRLARLSPEAAVRFAEELAARHGATLSDATARVLAAEAGGHPMFLAELVRAGGFGARSAEPVKLDEALLRRVRRLPYAAQRVLETVCLAGVPIPQETAGRAAAVDHQELPSAIAALRAELLVLTSGVSRQDTVEAYHDRIREAVVQALADGELPASHARLALALEQDPNADPEMLARHWQEAGHGDRAAHYALVGADRAMGTLAFERAVRLLDVVRELLPERDPRRPEVDAKHAEALTNAGRWAEAADLRLALASRRSGLEALAMRREAAEQLLCSGQFDRGVALLDELLRALGFFVPASPFVIVLSILVVRAWLRLRGLGYRERSEPQVDPRQLARLDALASAGYGLAMTDHVLANYFMTRGALLGLAVGEPHRLARSLAMTAGIRSSAGLRSWKESRALVAATQRVADRVGTPIALGMATQADAFGYYCAGDWTEAKERLLRAEAIYRTQCVGVTFNVDTVRAILYRLLAYRGDLRELATRMLPALREADAMGDVHAATNMRSGPLVYLHLAAGAPEQARAELAWVERHLPSSRYLMQHYFYVNGLVLVALYEGNAAEAHALVEDAMPRLRRSLLLHVAVIRALATELRGRAALARAALEPARRDELVQEAARRARELDGEGMAFATGGAALLRAGIAHVRGLRADALAHAAAARTAFEKAAMALHVATVLAFEGHLQGGALGAERAHDAASVMAAEGVQDPGRYARMLIPWCPELVIAEASASGTRARTDASVAA